MRVAVLLLAHSAPRSLAALAQYFAPSDCDLFVHLDRKIDEGKYRLEAADLPSRVKLLDARRKVYWAGFSMVEATLDLLRVAVRDGPYDRYVFISDDSFPVRSLEGFFQRLTASEDMIACQKPPAGHYVLARYDEYHLTDGDVFDCRRHWASPKPLDLEALSQLADLLDLRRRGKKPFEVFHGHASWALSHDSVQLALDTVENDPWLMQSFRFSAHADEFFFQSIVGAAKYPGGKYDGPTYSDGFRFSPRVIRGRRDLPLDMQSHFLFLRKIAPDFEPGLPEACLALYADLQRRLDRDPDMREQRIIALSDGAAPHLHLFAPAHNDPDWQGASTIWGRRFRTTQAEVCTWRLRAALDWSRLKLTLPCVGENADRRLADSFFEINGRRMPLMPSDVGYTAEFLDLAEPFDAISLHTKSGQGPGFPVAIMP